MHFINRSRAVSIVVTSIIIIISILVFSNYTKKVFTKNAFASMERNSVDSSIEIDGLLNFALNNIQVTSYLSRQMMTNQELNVPQDKLEKVLKSSPFDSIQYIRYDGTTTIDYPENKVPYDSSKEFYFLDGMKGNSGIYPCQSTRDTGITFIKFYAPIIFNGKTSGVITGTINATKKTDLILRSAIFGRETDGFLLDQNLKILCSTLEQYPPMTKIPEIKENQFISKLLRELENPSGKAFSYEEYGQEGIACISKEEKSGFYIVQIATPKVYSACMSYVTNGSYILIIVIIFTLMTLILIVSFTNRKKTEYSEVSLINIINALGNSFENIYNVEIDSGNLFIYRMSSAMKKSYGKIFASGNYETNLRLYAQNEVYAEDRELFEKIATISSVCKLLSENNEYSFIYRVLRSGELHFYECQLILADSTPANFIATFKNIDQLMGTSQEEKEFRNILTTLNSTKWNIEYDSKDNIASVHWTPEARKMLGYEDPMEFTDDINTWKSLIHPADSEKVIQQVMEIKNNSEKSQLLDVHYRLLTKNRGWRWFRTVGNLTRRQDNTPLHFTGLFIDVDSETKMMHNLKAIAKSNLSMHEIDLVNNTSVEFSTTSTIREFVNQRTGAIQQIENAMKNTILPEFLDDALTFTDLTTLPERMKEKQHITIELNGKFNGWIRASFYTVETDKEGRPTTVIFTTEVIQEEKENRLRENR